MKITEERLINWFCYHPPSPEQIPAYEEIREAGLAFARVILRLTPPSADQSAAIRKVREAVMTANAAIACQGQ
jgi:hypothetical protein